LAADYGGGAFFIPYLLALFLIGIPLLILEIGLGQYYQTGDVGVFGSFHRRWKGVGVSSVACAYMVVTYYTVLIAWVINAFFDSFGDDDPWAKEGTTGKIATNYFINKIIGAGTLGADGRPTRIVWDNVGYSALACTYSKNTHSAMPLSLSVASLNTLSFSSCRVSHLGLFGWWNQMDGSYHLCHHGYSDCPSVRLLDQGTHAHRSE
jgi:hypothetical protein